MKTLLTRVAAAVGALALTGVLWLALYGLVSLGWRA